MTATETAVGTDASPNRGETAPDPAVTYEIQGQQVTIPVEVRMARLVAATFTAPARAAQDLIEYSGLRVRRFASTLAVCSLAAIEYTDSDLGPYNEFALGIAVHAHDFRAGPMTTFIHRLPVNQPFACAAGRDIWGFPKWETDIAFVPRRMRTDVVVSEGDDLIAGLAVRHSGIPIPTLPALELACYSSRESVLRRTPWTMRLSDVSLRPGGATVAVGHEHPVADELRSLRFPKGAIMSASVGQMQATFGEPEVVEPVGGGA